MLQSTRREFLQMLTTATAATVVGNPELNSKSQSFQGANISTSSLDIVSKHKVVVTSPPSHIPKAVVTDALFIGNGDLLAAFAGESHQPQFWVTTNDFWEMREWGGPRPLGRIVFELPSLKNADYRVEQDLATATITATFSLGTTIVTMSSWVASAENLLVMELKSNGAEIGGEVSFRFPDELGAGVESNDYWNYPSGGESRMNHLPAQAKAWTDGILTADRTYSIDTDEQTRLTMAARLLGQPSGANDGTFTITPGETITFVAAFRSWFKSARPLDAAVYAASTTSPEKIEELRIQHQDWWKRYWSQSVVEIGEQAVELQYYRSHYNMGVFSRDPDFPPCDYGICTSDDPVCCADYKIDYNYQAGLLGLNVAGRFEQTDCYDSPGLAHLPRACADSISLIGHPGAYMSLGLGPKGMIPEHIWLGMKSQGAFYLVNTAERWYLTRDLDYARKVYPLVREVVRFWEHDLKWDGSCYPVVDDSGQEWTGHHCINTCAGVAFIQLAMQLAIDISSALDLDQNIRGQWQHINDFVGPLPIRDAGTLHTIFDSPGLDLQDVFPPGVLPGTKIIVFEGSGVDYSFECAIQTFPIYPCGQIGLDSKPSLLKAARNTIGLRILSESQWKSWPGPKASGIDGGAWFDGNHGCLFFISAIRVGYDPETIWEKLIEWCTKHVYPNGFRNDANDGLENYGAIPNAVHEMMLLSHENVLRIFRCWPRRSVPNARFENLWAYGAFQVSSELINGQVSYITIFSHKGSKCTIENAWFGKTVKLTRSNGSTKRLNGDRFEVTIRSGETVHLSKA